MKVTQDASMRHLAGGTAGAKHAGTRVINTSQLTACLEQMCCKWRSQHGTPDTWQA